MLFAVKHHLRLSRLSRLGHVHQNLDLIVLVFNQRFEALLSNLIWPLQSCQKAPREYVYEHTHNDFGDHPMRFHLARMDGFYHLFEVVSDVRHD